MKERRISTRRRALFYLIVFCLSFLFVETSVRVYFATQVGPRVLLYGTMFSRDQKRFDRRGTDRREAEEESTVAFHLNNTGEYTKYFPNERLFDRDEFDKRFDVRINSHGFRGDDFEVAKPPGVIRVVALGASSTFGFRSPDDDTYPVYLAKVLNEALPRLNAQRSAAERVREVEVINLGIPHLTSDQIYSLFMNEGLELQPDFVTFYEGINDAAWRPPPDTATEETKQTIKRVPLANQVFRAMRYRLLSVALLGSMISPVKYVYSEDDFVSYKEGKKERFIANLQLIYEACQSHGISFIVAGQQAKAMQRDRIQGVRYDEEQAALREKLSTTGRVTALEANFMVHKELMDAEREWAAAKNVAYADVIRAMDLNRQYLVSWVHLNAAGNRTVASALASKVLEQLDGGSEVTVDGAGDHETRLR